VVSLATAFQTVCVHTDSGKVYCLGENRFGEFGNGTLEPSSSPVLGAGGMIWERVFGSSGNARLCGITEGGVGYCWGHNANGEVGDGSFFERREPSAIAGDLQLAAIATSHHTCALTTAGRAYCWGVKGAYLGAGDDNWGFQPTPLAVATQQTYKAITTGMSFTCALRPGGEADCWGWGVGMGSGEGDRDVGYPTPVSAGHRFQGISAGEEHACGLDLSGAIHCWGKTGYGGPQDNRPTPVALATQLRFTQMVTGSRFGGCGITAEGAAYCWGEKEAPIAVPGNHRWSDIAPAGHLRYCGATPGGSVHCWRWWARGSQMTLSDPERIVAVVDTE